jgi:hypothetical protein
MERKKEEYQSVARAAATDLDDPVEAVEALFRQLDPQTLAGMILFCSSRYDLGTLAAALAERGDGLTVIGCTSSGEITPLGLREGTITAIGFPAADFTMSAIRFDDLDRFDAAHAHQVVRALVADAAEHSRHLGQTVSRAAIFLVDGLSHREEMLTVTVQDPHDRRIVRRRARFSRDVRVPRWRVPPSSRCSRPAASCARFTRSITRRATSRWS